MMVLCVIVVRQTSSGVTVDLFKISETILEGEKKTLHLTDDLQIISFLGSSVLCFTTN